MNSDGLTDSMEILVISMVENLAYNEAAKSFDDIWRFAWYWISFVEHSHRTDFRTLMREEYSGGRLACFLLAIAHHLKFGKRH